MPSPVPVPPLVSVAQLAARLAQGDDLHLVDARCDPVDGSDPGAGARAWRTAHLPGACHLDLDRDLSAPGEAGQGRHPLPDPAVLAATLARHGIGPGSRVVVYDAADGSLAAARAWWLLGLLGLEDVQVLDGGLAAWEAAHLPLEANVPSPRPPVASWPGRFRDGAVVGTGEVLAWLGEPGWLLDARAPARFRGEVEPIDPVAGHVPGAVNLPYADLVADGRLLPPEAIRERVRARLGNTAMAGRVLMCGSGVTACHLLLALHHAGLAGARVYAPSWSGWIADRSRPVARGGA